MNQMHFDPMSFTKCIENKKIESIPKFILSDTNLSRQLNMLSQLIHYNTDIQNWGEVGNVKLKGVKRFPNTMGLDEIIAIATKHRAAIIIKTTWQSIRKPGGWYIKGMTHMTHENEWLQTNGTIITHDELKIVCDRNQKNHKWSCRDCYLLKY